MIYYETFETKEDAMRREYAIKKLLKGKFYIVPGLDVKLGIFFSHFVPSSFIAKITYMMQKKKSDR